MLNVPACEENGASAFNLHVRAIAELDLSRYAGVQLGEDVAAAAHVIAGAHVQKPRRVALVAFLRRLHLRALLVEQDVLDGTRALVRGGEHAQADEEQRLLLVLGLSEVDLPLPLTARLGAVLGVVPHLVTVARVWIFYPTM